MSNTQPEVILANKNLEAAHNGLYTQPLERKMILSLS